MPGYKRKASGAYIGGRPYVRRRVARKLPRYSRGRISGRTGTRRGTRPNFSFYRWLTAFDGAQGTSFLNLTNCVYDVNESTLTCSAAQKTASFVTAFKFDEIPNVSEFANLFDSYMLTGVLIQFKLIDNPDAAYPTNGTGTSATINNSNFFPTIWYTADHDDAVQITLPQIKEYEKVRHKVLRPNRETSIMLRPTTLTQLYRSSLTTGYGPNRPRWIDMAQKDVPHYGFKCVFDFEGLAPQSSYKIKVNAKYFFKCKTVR